MRQIDFIAIHEAATPLLKPNGSEYTINDVDQWHRERGFRRSARWLAIFNPGLYAVGYQYVIGVRGDVWAGHCDAVRLRMPGENRLCPGVQLPDTAGHHPAGAGRQPAAETAGDKRRAESPAG